MPLWRFALQPFTYTRYKNILLAVRPTLFHYCTPHICQSVLKQCVFCRFFEAGSYWKLYSRKTDSCIFSSTKIALISNKNIAGFVKRDLNVDFVLTFEQLPYMRQKHEKLIATVAKIVIFDAKILRIDQNHKN